MLERRLFPHVVKVVQFYVGFVYDVHAEFVAEVVEVGAVGVVRCSYRVDVVLFHLEDVASRGFAVDCLRELRVVLVAVDPLEEHGLAVDENLTVFALHAPESNFEGRVHFDAGGRLEFEQESIEIGVFRAPLADALDERELPAAYHEFF